MRRTSWASCDLLRTTSLSFTAVCIRLTLDWFLQDTSVTGALAGPHPSHAQTLLLPTLRVSNLGVWAEPG